MCESKVAVNKACTLTNKGNCERGSEETKPDQEDDYNLQFTDKRHEQKQQEQSDVRSSAAMDE